MSVDRTAYCDPAYRDEHGRGPMLAYWQDSQGIVPHVPKPDPWRPRLPLSAYGELPPPAPKGSMDAGSGFWRAVLADVIGEAVEAARAKFHDDLNLKLQGVRKAFAGLRDQLRVEGEERQRAGELIDGITAELAELQHEIDGIKREARPTRPPTGNDNLRPPHVGVRATQALTGPV